MKKIILAVAAIAMLAASPASAQYYRDYPPPPPPGQRHYAPPPAYDHRGYERHGYDERRGPRHRPRMCVTSRGDCPASNYAAPGERCRCFIPGFGEKRGNVR